MIQSLSEVRSISTTAVLRPTGLLGTSMWICQIGEAKCCHAEKMSDFTTKYGIPSDKHPSPVSAPTPQYFLITGRYHFREMRTLFRGIDFHFVEALHGKNIATWRLAILLHPQQIASQFPNYPATSQVIMLLKIYGIHKWVKFWKQSTKKATRNTNSPSLASLAHVSGYANCCKLSLYASLVSTPFDILEYGIRDTVLVEKCPHPSQLCRTMHMRSNTQQLQKIQIALQSGNLFLQNLHPPPSFSMVYTVQWKTTVYHNSNDKQ